MKKIILALGYLLILVFVVWGFYLILARKNAVHVTPSPLNALYTVEGVAVQLVEGISEVPVVPGSSSKIVTRVFGEPKYGDLNEDGVEDAVMFLTQNPGGSGTFYYLVVALSVDGQYVGLGAFLLGDRIAPQTVQIKDGMVVVNYAERKVGDAMIVPPSVGVSKYLFIQDGALKEIMPLGVGAQVFSGNLVMGEGLRIFTPCGGSEHWVIGSSTAYKTLMSTYEQKVAGQPAYSPVYVVLSGTIVDAPTDGFGAEYAYGIEVQELIKTPKNSCS